MLGSRDSEYSYRREEETTIVEETILLLILTAIASVIRFWKLGSWSFWADEIFSVQDAQNFPNTITINPIVYAMINKVINLLGVSEWSARLAPCIVGIISVPLIYWFGRRLYGPQVGAISAFFIAIHPWHIFWSQNARAYSTSLFFVCLSCFFFYQALELDKVSFTVLALISTALSVATYLQSVLILPVFLGYIILLSVLPVNMPKGLNGKNIVVFFAPIIILASVVALTPARDYIRSGWGLNEWGRNYLYVLFTVIYSVGVPVFISATLGSIYSFAYLNRKGLFLTCYAIIPLIILMGISPFLNVAGYYLFFTMPAYIILSALCASEVIYVRRLEKAISLSVFFILTGSLIAQSYLYFTIENGGREKWKEAFSSIKDRVGGNTVVVVPMPRVAQYYLGNSEVAQLESFISNTAHSVSSWRSANKEVWFVLDEPSVKVLDPDLRFRQWLYKNCRLFAEFPVYARVMDRTIKIWRLDQPSDETKHDIIQQKPAPQSPLPQGDTATDSSTAPSSDHSSDSEWTSIKPSQ